MISDQSYILDQIGFKQMLLTKETTTSDYYDVLEKFSLIDSNFIRSIYCFDNTYLWQSIHRSILINHVIWNTQARFLCYMFEKTWRKQIMYAHLGRRLGLHRNATARKVLNPTIALCLIHEIIQTIDANNPLIVWKIESWTERRGLRVSFTTHYTKIYANYSVVRIRKHVFAYSMSWITS